MEVSSVSIVIPTHNRSAMVAALLQTLSIARSEFAGEAEILVLDSSADDEAAMIQVLCTAQDARYLRCANSVCVKRNTGIQQATGEIVFFTDSDCEVSADILEQHARVYRAAGQDIGGVLGLTTTFNNSAPIWRTLELDSSFTAAFSFALWLGDAPWGTCTNLSFRRQVLLQVGGFDEHWPLIIYGEDVDLGLRVQEAGFRIQCNPQAIAKHNSASISSMRKVLRKKFLSGRADYHLGRKHPAGLAPEFPGWPGTALLVFLVLLPRCLEARSLLPILWATICLALGVLFQAILAARAGNIAGGSVLRHAAVILFEATFELGRLIESLRHGEVSRLWTKFVYVERQLVGERDKRVRQMWACLVALSCLLILLSFRLAL